MATTDYQTGTVVTKEWLNDVDDHTYDQTSGKHSANHITNTPSGYTSATDVQTAFDDLGSSAGSSKVGFTQSGIGAVARTVENKERDIVDFRDWSPALDNTTNDATAFASMISDIVTGSIIWMPSSKTAKFVGNLTINKACTIYAEGFTANFPTNAANQGILITTSGVRWYGGTIVGPQKAVVDSTQRGIWANGTSYASPIDDIKILGVNLNTWTDGIYAMYATNIEIAGNTITDCRYSGIGTEALRDFNIHDNTIKRIHDTAVYSSGDNAYGIFVSNKASSAISKRGCINNNTIEDVRSWEGIDMHGGEDITIHGNMLRDTNAGIRVLDDPLNSLAPKRITIIGNTVFTNHGAGEIIPSGRPGIHITGVSTSELAANVIVSGNVLQGNLPGIACSYTSALSISGNISTECGAGIDIENDNQNINVSNNVMTHSGGRAIRIYPIAADSTYGLVAGNTMSSGTLSCLYVDLSLGGTATKLNFRDNDMKTTVFPVAASGGTVLEAFEGDIKPLKKLVTTWDPASIAAEGSETKDVTFTGLTTTTGVYAEVAGPAVSSRLFCELQAIVAVDKVTLVLFNTSASARDLVSDTYHITINKYALVPY